MEINLAMKKRRKQPKLNVVLILVLILIINSFLHGQIINGQNEIQNGKKYGLWIEYSYMKSIDINGERRLIWKQKYMPQLSIQEGQYINDERHGIETEAIKDTVILSEYSSKLVGTWQEYDEAGHQINSKDYKEAAAEKNNDSDTAEHSITKFIPEGYTLLDSATGDLNLDKYPDKLLVLKINGEDSIAKDVDHTVKRPLLILIGQANESFTLAARNDNVVYCVNCGGMMGDPYMQIVIKKGYFSIEHYGGSAWRWTRIITFKYSTNDKQWYLYKDGGDSYHTSDLDKVETNIKTTKEFGKIAFDKFDIYSDWK
jgi:hypothetical protein